MPLKLTFVIKKHSTNADTGTLYTTNHLRLTNEKTANGTTYSGTTPIHHCRQKNTCPLNGNCLQSSLIYHATVTCKENNTTETYIGLTENDFKTRYRNHTASFRHTKHRNSTELSKHTLKENNINHFISLRILSSRSPYNSANKRCNLCLREKLLIIRRPQNYHHPINVKKWCPHAATETKRYCVTIELSIEINRHAHYANFKVYKRWYKYS